LKKAASGRPTPVAPVAAPLLGDARQAQQANRADRLARIKASIEGGSYRISSEAIAGKFLERMADTRTKQFDQIKARTGRQAPGCSKV